MRNMFKVHNKDIRTSGYVFFIVNFEYAIAGMLSNMQLLCNMQLAGL